MLGIIAWRNVWRNPSRSLVVMGSMVLGVWALAFTIGFMNAFYINFIDSAISADYSHVQIHHPEYKTDRKIKYTITNSEKLYQELKDYQEVFAVTHRTISNGMVSSPKASTGVMAYGIDMETEKLVTNLDSP